MILNYLVISMTKIYVTNKFHFDAKLHKTFILEAYRKKFCSKNRMFKECCVPLSILMDKEQPLGTKMTIDMYLLSRVHNTLAFMLWYNQCPLQCVYSMILYISLDPNIFFLRRIFNIIVYCIILRNRYYFTFLISKYQQSHTIMSFHAISLLS